MVVAPKQVNEAEEAEKAKDVKEVKNAKQANESRDAKAWAAFHMYVGCEKDTRHDNNMNSAHGCREHKNMCKIRMPKSVQYTCNEQ